ncbi:polysaccharide biosynthesis C-terminal domain-containing protein, partial [Halorubrum ezzemoulense]
SRKAKGDPATAAQIYEKALSNGLLIYIPAAAGLSLVADPLIQILFGEQYLGAVPVLQVLSIFVILQSIKLLTDNGLDFLGHAQGRAIIKGITAVLNVCLNLILIPRIGVVGAASATVLTDTIYTISIMYVMSTEMDFYSDELLRKIVLIILITIIMSSVVYFLRSFIEGIISLMVVVFIGITVWFILSLVADLLDRNQISLG